MSTAKKVFGKIMLVLLIVVFAFVLLWLGLNVSKFIIYKDYLADRQNVINIPGLNSGFVPQGLCTVEKDTYIITGYRGENVILYYIKDGSPEEILLADESGNALEGHGGGVSTSGDNVFVADNSELYIYSLSEIKAGGEEKIRAKSVFFVDNRAAYCFADEKYIYVGEFYRAGNYETDESHHYTTPSGDENKAIISCYKLDKDGNIASETPEFAVSVTGLVQGFAYKDGTAVLSRSWGLSSSSLEFYDGFAGGDGKITLSGKEVPLYYLDSSNLKKKVSMPFFSEDIDVDGNRVIINFESACNKYIVGKFFFANKVTSYPIPDYAGSSPS